MGLEGQASASGPKSERPVKKRASQACSHCRTRKVKCDLVKSGVPCHNCKADGIECITTESRRSRQYRLQKRQLSRLTSVPLLPQTNNPNPATFPSQQITNAFSTPSPFPTSIPKAPSQSSQDQSSPPGAPLTANHQPDSTSAFTSVLSLARPTPSHHGTAGTPSTVQTSFPSSSLPSYIRPPQQEFNPDDLEFLNRRGAFSIPDVELRDQLLRSFILYVYPYLPVIDLQDFFDALDGRNGSQISLILFQAVMFAGTAFVDMEYLRRAGFSDRRSARGHFYNRIRLLYDFDWEADRPTIIQVIILHAYWYVEENDQKDPWHWLGIGISLAISAGLNQNFAYTKKDTKTRKLWRRIWWSCLIRDRIMAISMRKPMRLKDEDLTIPMLTVDDFDTQPFKTSIRIIQDCLMMDAGIRLVIAELCIAKINLLLVIGRTINKFYVLQWFDGSTADSIMLYTPKRSNLEAKAVVDLQDELNTWSRTLPTSCQVQLDNIHDQPAEQFLHLHRSVLSMIFWMASEALHRPQSLARGPSNPKTDALKQKSKPKIKEAADQMAGLIQSLRELDLVRFIPPIAVAVLLPAIASFLVEIKSMGKSLADLPGHQFHQCVRALLSLREIWPIADSACSLVGQMITTSQIGTARTLGMQTSPAVPTDQSTRESSVTQQPDDAPDTDVIEERGGHVDEGPGQPEIAGIAMPAGFPEYSPGNIGHYTGEWADQFQFQWTMAELGFNDDFYLDDRELYIDPAMADHSIDTAFNHDLMDFDTAGIDSGITHPASTYPAPTSENWNNMMSEQHQHFQLSKST